MLHVLKLANASDLEISFQHTVDSQQIEFASQKYSTNGGDTITIEKFKYYVGNLKFTYKSGRQFAFPDVYFLIDSEQPTSLKVNLAKLPEGEVTKIQFGVGVDSLSNDKGLISGALDPMNGMYWSWNSGFINFKLEGRCLSCSSTNEYAYHIGGFITPNETYQTVSLPISHKIEGPKSLLKLNVDLSAFLGDLNIDKLPRVMSPSVKAKQLAQSFPKMFNQ